MKSICTYKLFFLLWITPLLAAPSWEVFETMPIPVAGGETVVFNEKIYIFGGYSDSLQMPISLVQEFDPAAPEGARWSIIGHMLTPRRNFILALYNDLVYIVGGRTGMEDTNVAAMEVFSFAGRTSTWEEENSSLIRIGGTGVVWKNLWFIIGGYYSLTSDQLPPYAVVYDLETRKILFQPSFAVAAGVQYDHVAVLAKDRIYLFGGVRLGVSSRVFELNPETLELRRIHPDLKSPLAGFKAVAALNDTIYLVGGYSEKMKSNATVNKFYASSRGFELAENAAGLNYPRYGLMAAYVDSTIYALGGRGEHAMISSVERLSLKKTGQNTAAIDKGQRLDNFRLYPNYPNPFNSQTTISLDMPYRAQVRLEIFAANGQGVRTLYEGFLDAGSHALVWDGNDASGRSLTSGVFFYRLTTPWGYLTNKMLLVK
ncbi:MAG: hypothetical protein EHM72_13590 [Calditrichaeota bacterium]|nr:MAG: hypothetical protein EHM72_13590 [Calditrichota bacterium]